ncbi:MAG: transglutaminase family protein [Rhodocyclaceae bacterium]|nr:transglutaminase family protein [Rhodocyclaceae bacterium]MBX3669745.1 transglutaminase family protein [Rhodocyclaceae bacterium]
MPTYVIEHDTLYSYSSPVAVSRQLLHMSPRATPWQRVLEHRITIEPHNHERRERDDFYGNRVVDIAIVSAHRELRVRARSLLEVLPHAANLQSVYAPAWEEVRAGFAAYRTQAALDAWAFACESPYVPLHLPALARYADTSFTPGRPLLEAVADLNTRIHEEFAFDAEATSVATPMEDVLRERRGVCQDFAHLMAGCLRAKGLPARYVSGYLLTTPPPGRPRLIGADASHAWVSVYCPQENGALWIDFDPTNNCIPDTEHMVLGWGRDFYDVTPMRGVILGGGEQSLSVHVTVVPEHEAENLFRQRTERESPGGGAPLANTHAGTQGNGNPAN